MKSTKNFSPNNSNSISKNGNVVYIDESSNYILNGQFSKIPNDFSTYKDLQAPNKIHTINDIDWIEQNTPGFHRARYVICTLALVLSGFCLMSRGLLNIAIVEMVHKPISHHSIESTTVDGIFVDQIVTTDSDILQLSQDTSRSEQVDEHNLDQADEEFRFHWSNKEVNILLSSFYLGYAPGILISAGVAKRYGAKYPLLVCLLGTGLVNVVTPSAARYSYKMLAGARVFLGLVQGCLIPALYDLFIKWLTDTEMSIFTPLIRVSITLGIFIGSLMPGLLSVMGYHWPTLFYVASIPCLIWSLIWATIATSTPQESLFVSPVEMERIMRKKEQPIQQDDLEMQQANNKEPNGSQANSTNNKHGTDLDTWLKIIFSPSVLALTFVKLTFNIGIDMFALELSVYLSNIHEASIETISVILSGNALMQMGLVTFVGWAVKVLVQRRAFGMSVTNWRKIFQGMSNLGMALFYLLIPMAGSNLVLVASCFLMICFWTMWAVGGESMVPFDLSKKYTAIIVGLAHSVSVLSGFIVPFITNYVIGEEIDNKSRWNLLFMLTSFTLTLGSLVFSLVLKSKPFLPGEKNSNQIGNK